MGVSFVRTIIIFFTLAIAIRIMGKRQLGEIEPIELVVAILISNLASQPLADIGIPLLYGLVPIMTLLACQVIISGIALKNIRLHRFISGNPSVLIDNGVIVQAEMKKNRISIDELYAELRGQQVTDISTVKHAILETDGSLSVLLYENESPVTPSQLGISVSEKGSPVPVISDGRILNDNLRLLGYNNNWLTKQLSQRKVKNAKDVFLMTVDGDGNIYFAKKEAVS